MEDVMGKDWSAVGAQAAGFAPDIVNKIDAGRESGLLYDLHTVAVAQNGQLAFERYYTSHDEKILADLGTVSFAPDTLHDLRSVTKSLVSLLYGIALGRGLVPPVDTPAVDAFPEYADLASDPARRRVTIRHALTMTMGFEWDESKPYTGPENSEIAMEMAPDRYRFVLDRPIVAAPGEKWIYSGGAVALLGALIERGTKLSLADFARDALFAPLGITEFEWWAGRDGVYSAAAGLRLSTHALLKIGAMLIDGGRHDGDQIVPESWLGEAFARQSQLPDGTGYGYLWYTGETYVPALDRKVRWINGAGNGGQRLHLVPELKLAGVSFAGDYNRFDRFMAAPRLWNEIVLAGLMRA
jgi:CubicO group peptidase (beta-lactamase class C family)